MVVIEDWYTPKRHERSSPEKVNTHLGFSLTEFFVFSFVLYIIENLWTLQVPRFSTDLHPQVYNRDLDSHKGKESRVLETKWGLSETGVPPGFVMRYIGTTGPCVLQD